MSQDDCHSKWADMLETEMQNPHFKLQNFLNKHNITERILLDSYNPRIVELLVCCRDFGFYYHKDYTHQIYFTLLKLMFKNKETFDKIYHRNVMYLNDIIETLGSIPYRVIQYGYDPKNIIELFINYCERNDTYIDSSILNQIINYIVDIFVLTNDQMKIIIRYYFKHDIGNGGIFYYLLRYNKEIFTYAIKLCNRKVIYLNHYVPDKYINKELFNRCITLESNFVVCDLGKCLNYYYRKYLSTCMKYKLLHGLMWMDEQQRFTINKKDTLLLDKLPIAAHIKEFMF